MKIIESISDLLAWRSAIRKLKDEGFREVQLHRGSPNFDEIIADVAIGPDGRSLWLKVGKTIEMLAPSKDEV